MTSIKAPGGPAGPSGPGGPSGTGSSAPTGGASFREVVGTGARPPTNASQSVIGDLTAGKITPDQAVDRLTTLAIEKSRCPESARPAVEQRIRQMLATDPVVGDLLRQMGASIPTDA